MKKVLLKICLICFLSFAFHSYAKAQGDIGGDPEVPLDPGSWVLVAAGVGYGIKKWKNAKQQNHKNVIGTDINEKEKESNNY